MYDAFSRSDLDNRRCHANLFLLKEEQKEKEEKNHAFFYTRRHDERVDETMSTLIRYE